MSSNRGLANQALYQGQILLDAWELSEREGQRGPRELAAAFCPAVLAELLRAYGWFLLAVAKVEPVTDASALPARVADLAPPPEGRSRAPELAEFELLERDGWLGEMIRARQAPSAAPSTVPGALASDRQMPGRGELRQWAGSLASTMQRMDDSLDEY